jgi:glycosyltransferase involved in cell wall biosynthesis
MARRSRGTPRFSRTAAKASRFAGHRTGAQAFYPLADVFVLPSHREGSPNVVRESIAAGTPIVATRAVGVPEMLRDRETALLVPPRDPQALAAA